MSSASSQRAATTVTDDPLSQPGTRSSRTLSVFLVARCTFRLSVPTFRHPSRSSPSRRFRRHLTHPPPLRRLPLKKASSATPSAQHLLRRPLHPRRNPLTSTTFPPSSPTRLRNRSPSTAPRRSSRPSAPTSSTLLAFPLSRTTLASTRSCIPLLPSRSSVYISSVRTSPRRRRWPCRSSSTLPTCDKVSLSSLRWDRRGGVPVGGWRGTWKLWRK